MTRQPRHPWRLLAGRPRTSTLVLIVVFFGVFALYIQVRPATGTEPAGNAQRAGTTSPARSPAARTRSSAVSPTASPPASATATATPAASPTPTATPAATGSPAP